MKEKKVFFNQIWVSRDGWNKQRMQSASAFTGISAVRSGGLPSRRFSSSFFTAGPKTRLTPEHMTELVFFKRLMADQKTRGSLTFIGFRWHGPCLHRDAQGLQQRILPCWYFISCVVCAFREGLSEPEIGNWRTMAHPGEGPSYRDSSYEMKRWRNRVYAVLSGVICLLVTGLEGRVLLGNCLWSEANLDFEYQKESTRTERKRPVVLFYSAR